MQTRGEALQLRTEQEFEFLEGGEELKCFLLFLREVLQLLGQRHGEEAADGRCKDSYDVISADALQFRGLRKKKLMVLFILLTPKHSIQANKEFGG
ncbi:hypothetical protein E2562_014756 [Oryza meyeriana var. granulata]|uniref:Uncharacterized protein n=1 Tax=Oryza meyeriana var. granulata TaxID=110450 RepID=A0A6G1BKR3_9ORYZ|nr:hypothetical protein E2562_014756 [Oryza meyeriana var. granulata]